MCPCGSEKLYAQCCEPLHKGIPADSPEQLMRSRYSAYALQIPEYIITTTHPSNPLYRKDIAAWSEEIRRFGEETRFEKLDILEVEPGDPVAYVTFTAHLSQGTFTERSRFDRVGNRWLYRAGEVSR